MHPACLLAIVTRSVLAADADVDLLAGRLRDSLVSSTVAGSIPKWLANQSPDGTWPDIDYADKSQTGWSPVDHVTRLQNLSVAWAKPGTKWTGVDSVLRRIRRGAEVYLARNPVSTNWWYNEIGEDLPWGQMLILLRGTIADSTLSRWALRIDGNWSKWTGANLSWEGSAHIYRSIVRDEPAGIDSVLKRMREQVVLVDSGDGLHRDFSFAQHSSKRTFPYNGGYGQNFLDETIRWWVLAQGTRFAFTPSQTALLDSMILDGSGWMIHQGRWDPTMIGRGLVRPGILWGRASLTKNAADLRTGPQGASLDSLRDWLADRKPWYRNPDKVFWTCGYLAHHGPGWMTSVRAPRLNETATEAGNGENIKGWFLGYGSTWFRVRGDEQDLVWPLFDWASIPGVTNDRVDTFPGQSGKNGFGYIYGTTEFVGGVSNGQVSAFAYDYKVSAVTGKKAWFQTADAFVALGAGLSFDAPRPVSTSIDQRWARGAVTIGQSARSLLGPDSLATGNLAWLHHDSIGYWFPVPESLVVGTKMRTGTWKAVDTVYTDTLSKGRLFFARVEHGQKSTSASYAYAVVPGVSADSMERWVAGKPLSIVANSTKVQAIQQGSLRAMVFHAPDTLAFPDGLRIAVDRPCALLRSDTPSGTIWTASFPDRKSGTLSVSHGRDGNWIHIALDLPGGSYAGSSKSLLESNGVRNLPRGGFLPGLRWVGDRLEIPCPALSAEWIDLDGSLVKIWRELPQGALLDGAMGGKLLRLRMADGRTATLKVPLRK